MGHREMSAPPVRKVVRDADYSWGTSAMMNLYSGTTCPFSHRCRIVLYEKQMDFQVIDVDLMNKPEEMAIINPYNHVPVLVDRDLVLYDSNIINEYIDERFPHPQLMPPDPQTRAKARQLLFTMESELFSHVPTLEKNLKTADKSRAHIRDRLMDLSGMFNKQKYLLADEFSMLDVAIAPLLWRLDHYGIELPKTASSIMKYAERIFSRQGFIDALTPTEKAMRR
jgi:RNA polymerase-associated protein